MKDRDKVKDTPCFLTVNDVTKSFNLNPHLIRWWIRTHALTHYKIGKKVLIKKSDILEFVEAHRREAVDVEERLK